MKRLVWIMATLWAASAAPTSASPFEGVWKVEPRRPPAGRPAETAPPARDGVLALPPALAGLEGGDHNVYRLMTPQGRAVFETFDPKRLPANNCQSPGLPSIAMTPNLQVWSVTGDILTIHHEYFDTRRQIALGAGPPAGAPSALGHAVGHLDGETLRIDTSGLAPSWGALSRNAPGSGERSVRETYRLEGADTLRGEIIIVDPAYLTQPLTLRVTLKRAPPGTVIETFPCDVEASRRHLQR